MTNLNDHFLAPPPWRGKPRYAEIIGSSLWKAGIVHTDLDHCVDLDTVLVEHEDTGIFINFETEELFEDEWDSDYEVESQSPSEPNEEFLQYSREEMREDVSSEGGEDTENSSTEDVMMDLSF